MVTEIEILGRRVGPGHPCFIIAEAGVNHNGSLEAAHRMVDAATESGADAVKFQSFSADRLATPLAPKAAYQRTTTDAAESQLEMLRRLEIPSSGQRNLRVHCMERGILFMSSPFDEGSADLLEEMGIAVFKIPSGELTNLPFLEHVARKGKPMIVSTGMSNLSEVSAAVKTIEASGNHRLVLLHCVSCYPAEPAQANLRAIQTLAAEFNVPVGYSDHTLGIEVALGAVAMGACVIEKHFTLDRALPGPDQRASLEPRELEALVRGIRIVEAALGDGRKEPTPGEAGTIAAARKCLVSAREIPAGTTLTQELIAVRRSGAGLPPAMRSSIVGRTVRVSIPEGTLITPEMLA